ncbi:MAG TPA: hypothetical protein PLW16_08300 [Syntrophales bacterium]|nr:hypothetical protein [Syntrophales bacterium]
MNLQVVLALLAVAVALVVAVWRFSGGSYGKLRPSAEASAAYEAFQVQPDLTYYISGSDVHPNALMGIDASWTLASDLWKKRDLTPEGLKELVRGMQAKALERLAPLQGFDILDHRDRQIGTWFSLPGPHVSIRIREENRVEISTPPLNTYHMDE